MINALDEPALVVHKFQVFAHNSELVLFPLDVELEAYWEVFFHDLALVCKLSNPRLRIKQDHVVCREGICQLKLLFDSAFLVHVLPQIWDSQDKFD